VKQATFSLYFFSLGILFIILEHLNNFLPALIVKSLIIPALMLYYHLNIRKSYTSFHRLMMIGLFFSWLGDVLLQFANDNVDLYFDSESYFLFGLAAFLGTQVFYFLAFIRPKGANLIFSKRIYQLVMVLGYGFLLLWFLYNKIPVDMRLPVIVYAIVIHAMLAAALNRYGKVNGVSYMLIALGALMFVLSDSMIAVTKFHQKIDFARIIIMISYIVAQYLIIMGAIKQDSSQEK